MDYVAFCRNYYDVTHIPVSLLDGDVPVYSSAGSYCSLEMPLDRWKLPRDVVFPPTFYSIISDIQYGGLRIQGTDYFVFLGPIFSFPVTDEIVRLYMKDCYIPAIHKEVVSEFLCTIPLLSQEQFTRHLILINAALNQQELHLEDYISNDQEDSQRMEKNTDQILQSFENNDSHGTYFFEQEMYQAIRDGNTAKLELILKKYGSGMSEGKLANTPLRHAKNLFILTIGKVVALGAIPGGLDTERAYQLADLYIQECEGLQSLDAVRRLHYAMVHDFCRRVRDAHVPEGISEDIFKCVNFIRSHSNDNISIEDVARHIHRSVSYTVKHFKQEMGVNVGEFIMNCKLEEACDLLSYTDKTLAQISYLLSFSSQSYFQNVFKKRYGATPLQYRKRAKQV